MVNYSNGKIYKLINNVDDKIYIGSTCNTLRQRKDEHKRKSKTKNFKVYNHLNEAGWENVVIILIEKYPCNNFEELRIKEQEYIDKFNPELNDKSAKQTPKQYYEKNKEQINNWNKNYQKENKEQIIKWKKEMTECECGGKYSNNHKSRHMKTKKHLKYIQ